jgi:hypothetical protein
MRKHWVVGGDDSDAGASSGDHRYKIRTHECQADNGAPALALASNGQTTSRACS